MSNAAGIVATIFLLMSVGMLLAYAGILKDGHAAFLSAFVVKVAFPAAIVQNLFSKFTSASLRGMAAGLIAPLCAVAAVMLIFKVICARLNLPVSRRGGFMCLAAFSNSVFIGLPVCTAIYGEEAAAYTLVYYIVSTTLFWSAGYALMRRDGENQRPERSFKGMAAYLFSKDKSDPRFIPQKNALKFVSKLLPPPLLALVISIALILPGVTLPGFVMDTAKYLGGCVTPLSLIYIGCRVEGMLKSRSFTNQKGYGAALLGKFVLLPLLTLAFIKLTCLIPAFDALLTPTLRKVLVMEAAMPVMTQTAIVESDCGGDGDYAAGAVCLTTVLSFGVIPLYTFLIDILL